MATIDCGLDQVFALDVSLSDQSEGFSLKVKSFTFGKKVKICETLSKQHCLSDSVLSVLGVKCSVSTQNKVLRLIECRELRVNEGQSC